MFVWHSHNKDTEDTKMVLRLLRLFVAIPFVSFASLRGYSYPSLTQCAARRILSLNGDEGDE